MDKAITKNNEHEVVKVIVDGLPAWQDRPLKESCRQHVAPRLYRGSGPHLAQIRCDRCNRHIQWVSPEGVLQAYKRQRGISQSAQLAVKRGWD